MRVAALFWLMIGAATATQVYLMPAGPMVADGETAVTLHIWVPSLGEEDRVKVKPAQWEGVGHRTSSGRHDRSELGASLGKWFHPGTGIGHRKTQRFRCNKPSASTLPSTTPRPSPSKSRPVSGNLAKMRCKLKLRLTGTSDQLLGDSISLAASTGTKRRPSHLRWNIFGKMTPAPRH